MFILVLLAGFLPFAYHFDLPKSWLFEMPPSFQFALVLHPWNQDALFQPWVGFWSLLGHFPVFALHCLVELLICFVRKNEIGT